MFKNKKLTNFINFLVGLALIIYLISKLNTRELMSSFKNANILYFSLAIATSMLTTLIQAFRLHVLLKNYAISRWATFKVLFIGIFFNNFLPGSTGGDLYKIYYLNQDQKGLNKAISIVTFERFFSLFLVVTCGLVYSVFNYQKYIEILGDGLLEEQSFYILLLLLLFLLLVTLILFRKKLRIISKKIWNFLTEYKKTLKGISSFQLTTIILLSLLSILLRMGAFYFLIISLGEDFFFLDIIIVISIVSVVTLLPISVGSLGVREGILAICFLKLGITYQSAVGVSLLNRFIIWSKALIGGGIYISDKASKEFKKSENTG